jgi:hypothetical protein
MKVISAKTKKNREKIENRFIYIMLFVQIIVGSEECSKAKKKKKSKKKIEKKTVFFIYFYQLEKKNE